MKIIATLLLLVSSAPLPNPTEADAKAIVRAVLAREAYIHGSDRQPVCVKAAVDGFSMEGWRRDPHSAPLGLPWTELSRFDGKFLRNGDSLSSSDAESLNEALQRVVNGPPVRYLVRKVDAAWLPKPFKFCSSANQWRRLEIDSPVIAGDVAFVAADYFCPLCGEGAIFALRRSASGWTVVAETSTWIS